jgi:uncharacterized YigZ family protein
MSEKLFYNSIARASEAVFKDRGSKFLAYAFPVETAEEFKTCLQRVKKEHPKASHHCFAYRIGTDGNNFRSSDAGEPSGTAGKPILGQIDSREVTNTGIIVVRYFGGTLLGVPGLIHAYKSAASMALQVTPILQKAVETKYDLQFDYTQMNEIIHVIKSWKGTVYKQEMQLFCTMQAGIPLNRVTEFENKLNEFNNVTYHKSQ